MENSQPLSDDGRHEENQGSSHSAWEASSAVFGILNIDKPRGLTSRDVVNGVQRLTRPHKAGHAGTLDPLATGVLVVCLGKATRLIQYVQQQPKRYLGEFQFGLASDTEDIEGEVTRVAEAHVPSADELQAAIPQFVGEIEQRPPAFSALKVKGKRAYQLARQGEAVELASRRIMIYGLKLVSYSYPRFQLDIECGSGTYVRSLGRDIAAAVHASTVMTSLRRVAVGTFQLATSIPFTEVTADRIASELLPAAMAVSHLPTLTVSDSDCHELRNGRRIPNPGLPARSEVAAMSIEGSLVAILEVIDAGYIQPKRVFL
jgi:tRNA pseudouridine55 synthase